MRTRTLVLLAAVVTVVPIGLAGVAQAWRTPHRVPVVPVAQGRPSAQAHALAVLRGWDRRRSAAWAAGDVPRLAALYVPGSRTGRHDVADLRRWTARGLRVAGLRQQVASLLLTRRAPRRMVLVVADRTLDGIAVGGGRRTAVPASAWATHRIVLRRGVDGSWRVAETLAQPAR